MKEKPQQTPIPGVEADDHVFFRHEAKGVASGRVVCHGKHGCTIEHEGKHHRVYWSNILGHKERGERSYKVVEHGEAGAIIEDGKGRRRFVASQTPPKDPRPDEPSEDDHKTVQKMIENVSTLQKSIEMGIYRHHPVPTPAQAAAGNYKKPRRYWQGLEIAVENPAGSVREGVDRGGHRWQTRMLYDYGYVVDSMGVDGDPVDVYVGMSLDAPLVYVIHQRKAGAWDEYDEDKVMIGFTCEEEAVQAYLRHYDNPRFLGPVTAMPVDEFVDKVKATKDAPAMIKALLPDVPILLILK